jgi:hypothetical protein
LASGNRKNHIPFSNLISDSSAFVNDRYVPDDFVWKDPRNLTKDAILDLCNHIRKRQDDYGPEEGFRFSAYFDRKQIVPADYGTRTNEEKAANRSKKQKRARKDKRGNKKQKNDKDEERASHAQPELQSTDINTPTASPNMPENKVTPAVAGEGHHISTDNGTISNTYVPQIDPSLINEDDMSTRVTRRTTVLEREPRTDMEGGYIDDSSMQVLMANGYSNMIPSNGPMDGPPRYFVTAAALEMLRRISAAETQSNVDQAENQETKIPQHSSKDSGRKGNTQNIETVFKPRRSGRSKDKSGTTQMQTRSNKKNGKASRK